ADAPVRKKPGPKPGFKAASAQKSAPADAASPPDMYGITRELAKLLSSDVRAKLNKVSDDDVLLLFRSLSVQATFNEEKQSRLALIKCLLLV
ncbi:MAG: hypothetical protein FWF80_02245, partial [Defluviitaleaceae bacterium]|nr:hypothetical protein [Defluviitaleaceae bacterium]